MSRVGDRVLSRLSRDVAGEMMTISTLVKRVLTSTPMRLSTAVRLMLLILLRNSTAKILVQADGEMRTLAELPGEAAVAAEVAVMTHVAAMRGASQEVAPDTLTATTRMTTRKRPLWWSRSHCSNRKSQRRE